MVENPADPTSISLLDGLPLAHYIEPNLTYSLTYQNHNEGRSNIVLSGPSELLERLSIKFTEADSQEHYLIRPKFFFPDTNASQSFQLVPLAGTVLIELHLVSGRGGWLKATAEVKEHISLPLDYAFSSILKYNEYDDYVIEGVTGSVDVEIKKCVDCVIRYAISE
jgi:hypothetical protein